MRENKLEWIQEVEAIQNAIILKTSDEIDEGLWDDLDDLYDELSAEDAQISNANTAEEDDRDTAGIYIQLNNGEQTIAKVNPLIMNRILDVISMDELNDFVEAIVASVEAPDDSAICQKK